MANNFISSMDNDEECVMHSKNDNIEIMINDQAKEVIKELFDSLKKIFLHKKTIEKSPTNILKNK